MNTVMRLLSVWHGVYFRAMLALRVGLWVVKHVVRTLWRGWGLR